jgi:hypothetical protein
MSDPRRAATVPGSARREHYRPPTREIGDAMIPDRTTTAIYPHIQEPSAPLLPALPPLDAVVVRTDPQPFPPLWITPWYRRPAAVCAAITTAAVITTAAITMWAVAPAAVPAPAPVVVAAAPAAPAPAPVTASPAAPAGTSSSDLGGVAVFAVIAGVCCLLGKRGGGKPFTFTGSGRVG